MKKGILGEGLMNIISILVLVGILVVFFIVFTKTITYSDLKNIEEIVSSKKVNSDGGVTIKNLLNTPVDDMNLYEFMLLNKNDEFKISGKVNELMRDICGSSLDPSKEISKNICFWSLKITFHNKEISIESEMYYSNDKSFLYELILPDYENNLVKIKLWISYNLFSLKDFDIRGL